MNRIPRFDFVERAVHWMTAISFLFAALSGLGMWSHKLFWLTAVIGGGSTARFLHPWGGTVFALVLALMFRRWASQMKLDGDDKVWLRDMHKYATNDEAGMPEPGKFNAGQKLMFWAEAFFAILLLVTGVVLWFPESMPRALRLAAVLIHPLAAIGAIGGIIVHIYMTTTVVRGSVTGMVRGYVSPKWAAAHHPKWFKQIQR